MAAHNCLDAWTPGGVEIRNRVGEISKYVYASKGQVSEDKAREDVDQLPWFALIDPLP